MTRVALIGATGRMGTAIVRASVADETLAIIAAVASAGSKSTGRDVGVVAGIKALGLPVIDELPPDLAHAEVAIDFSRPELSLRVLQVCRAARVPIVIGTTGHGAEFDIEIAEAHHKHKLDAPSGTALALADSAARARGLDPKTDTVAGRSGQGARRSGEIGIASLRAGDIVGTHTVLFAGFGERLTIGHEATDRSIFALGALRAAKWLATQKPGRYAMANVLGLKTIG